MNLEEIRARLAQLANRTSKNSHIWKPREKHIVRCLPNPFNTEDDDPFIEAWFHYGLGDVRSVLCPKKNWGEECVVCDFAEKLYSYTDEKGEQKDADVKESDFELFKKIVSSDKWFVAMVERTKEGLVGPKWWGLSPFVYNELLKIALDEENNEDREVPGIGVLTDFNDAYDVNVELYKANNQDGKGNKKPFNLTEVKERKKTSKLAASKQECKEILDKIPEFFGTVYQKVTSEEIEKIFNDFIASGATEKEPDDGTDGVEHKSNSAEAPIEGISVDEAVESVASDEAAAQ